MQASLSFNVLMLVILYAGGNLISAGTMTVGELSSFLVYAVYVGYSVDGLTGFYTELVKGVAAGSRLFHLDERVPAIPVKGEANLCSLLPRRWHSMLFAILLALEHCLRHLK